MRDEGQMEGNAREVYFALVWKILQNVIIRTYKLRTRRNAVYQ